MGMTVAEVQQGLTDLGYEPGSADGVWGQRSAAACTAFQRDQGLAADGIPGPSTQAALQVALGSSEVLPPQPLPPVMAHAQSLGLQVWGDPFRLWLFGVRSPSRTAGTFDDALGACWTEGDGLWRCQWWPGTTDPGLTYMQQPLNSAGCAILVPGQYLDTWTIDLHAGKYQALCQRAGEVAVYRDNDRDAALALDPATIKTGSDFGINIHASTRREGEQLTTVGRYSAGCQVHASEAGFSSMMKLAQQQVQRSGRETFSYTLLDRWW